ncbi:Uncharacterised protein [uncultured archaeon]|nr:Uncharacterised protein [uncultured archaeon]
MPFTVIVPLIILTSEGLPSRRIMGALIQLWLRILREPRRQACLTRLIFSASKPCKWGMPQPHVSGPAKTLVLGPMGMNIVPCRRPASIFGLSTIGSNSFRPKIMIAFRLKPPIKSSDVLR